jgi:hypothetical protein
MKETEEHIGTKPQTIKAMVNPVPDIHHRLKMHS